MSISSRAPVRQRTSRAHRRTFAQVAVVTVAAVGMLLSSSRTAGAQSAAPQPATWELRFTSGRLVPTGAERTTLKDAELSAAQISWIVRPSIAITGTVGWARSSDITTADDSKLDVFTYDLGAEARGSEWFTDNAVTFAPFVGAGAGARSYNYRNLDVDATHNVAAYGSMGGDLAIRRVQLRIEARDYVTGFKPLSGVGAADTRNDVVVMIGVRITKP